MSLGEAIAGGQWYWAVVGRQVAVHGGPGSAGCQVFTLESHQKYEVDSLLNVHLRKRKLRPREVNWLIHINSFKNTKHLFYAGTMPDAWGCPALQELTDRAESTL